MPRVWNFHPPFFGSFAFVKTNLEQSFKLLPDTTLFIGNSWKSLSKQNDDISFETNSIYSLTAIDDGIVDVQVSGKIGNNKTISSNIMGNNVTTDLNGEQTGTIKIDQATGILIESKINSSVEGVIQLLGKEVPVKIKTKKEISVKRM